MEMSEGVRKIRMKLQMLELPFTKSNSKYIKSFQYILNFKKDKYQADICLKLSGILYNLATVISYKCFVQISYCKLIEPLKKPVMKRILLYVVMLLSYSIATSQQGKIIPLNSSQSGFMSAYKLVLNSANKDFHTSGTQVDAQLFPEYGEHSIYWILSGANKGSFVLPGSLPEGFTGLTSTIYSGYDWTAAVHRAIHFNSKTERIAVFKSKLKVNDQSVSWEAMYFKNLFETYLFPDVVETINEDSIQQDGISDSVRILIIPAFSFKGEDGSFYPAQVVQDASFLKKSFDAFLQRGGIIYTEGNAVSLLEELGYLQDGSVNYGNSLNSGTESRIACSVTDALHPISFNASDIGNKIFSGTIPEVIASGIQTIVASSSDNRPLIFQKSQGGGKIICNLGIPTASSSEKRQLQWTMNSLLYALSSEIDVVRNVENELPSYLQVGRNAISFDRVDSFIVKVTVRNLSNTTYTNISIKETIPDYLDFVEVVSSTGSVSIQQNSIIFDGITLSPKTQIELAYRLKTPVSDDPVHQNIDDYLSDGNLLPVSKATVSYTENTGTKVVFGKYSDNAEVMFSARIFADTDVNWKNFLGLHYQPFKVFMIMENKQRTPAEEVVYTQYIPKDVPFYQSDQSLNIPILKTPGGKFITVLKGSNDENAPEYDIDSDGDPDVWLDTASIYPKGYTIVEEEVYWANPWSHLKSGYENIDYEDIDHDGNRAQDLNGDGVVDTEEPGDKIRVWKVTWNIGQVKGYQYFDPYCSYELWIDPPDLVNMSAGIGYVNGELDEPVEGMFYPYSPDIESPNIADTSWRYWMDRENNGDVIWKQLIYQRINNYEGFTFIDTTASGYMMLPTDKCAGTVPQPHNEFLAVVSLGGEEIDMYHPVPSKSLYSKINYKTIFNEERVTPIRTTYTYWAPLPNPLQFEFLSNNFIINDTLGNRINYLPSNGKASITFDIDATTEYTYYWIRNFGYDVHFNDPSLLLDGVDGLGDGVFGYFIYDIPKGMGGYSITLPKNEDGSYNIDSIVEIDGNPFSRWIDNPNTGNTIEIWEDPFEYHVYVPQILIPAALYDDNNDGIDDWIDDRGDRFHSETGYLHDAFMKENGEEYPGHPATPFTDDIYGLVESGWFGGADGTYGDDFYEKPGKMHIRIRANYEGKGREGSLEISKGGTLVVEEIFGGSPWVIFSHVLSSFAKGTDIEIKSEVVPSIVKYGTDTAYIRHTIKDINEPHQFNADFDPYHHSYGYGESAVTTIVGGKDPCSLIEPVLNTSSIVDPLKDETTITIIPDPDPALDELSAFPKIATGTFIEVRIEVMNGTDDNWINTVVTPVIPSELGNTSLEFSYVAYPRPLVPGDDIGTFKAGWRFNQPEGEVLVKLGNTLPLLQPSRRAYYIYLFKIDKALEEGIYSIGFDLNTERVYYTGVSKGNYSCDVPDAMLCVARKGDNKRVIDFQKMVLLQAQLQNLTINKTSNLEFTGEIKWSANEIVPDDFENITNKLTSTVSGNSETIDLSKFRNFPQIDTTTLVLMEKVIVNSTNSGENLKIVNNESLTYSNPVEGDYIVPHKSLYVTPTGPRISIHKKIFSVNGYNVEDTLVFEPDRDIVILTLFEVTNTGNDISSNTTIYINPGKFYETLVDSLPAGSSMQAGNIVISAGGLVPGESKKIFVFFKLKKDIRDKTELMDLILSSNTLYKGTSVNASYTIADKEKVLFGIHDFQLFAATSLTNGNTSMIEVTAVNRGLPAKEVYLRIFPIVDNGIAELPLAEAMIDSFATYGEFTLNANYIIPNGSDVKFLAIIDDGDDTREVFELNNSLLFDAEGIISGLNEDFFEEGAFIFPNPVIDDLNICYNLKNQAKSLTIHIISVNGRTIDVISNIPLNQGNHLVKWRTSTVDEGLLIILIDGTDVDGEIIRHQMKVVKKQ